MTANASSDGYISGYPFQGQVCVPTRDHQCGPQQFNTILLIIIIITTFTNAVSAL